MQILIYILAIVGALVAVMAILVVYSLAIPAFLDWRREPHRPSFDEGIQQAQTKLSHQSWWFSESPEVMELLADLARGLNVDVARDRWRNARKELAVPVDPADGGRN